MIFLGSGLGMSGSHTVLHDLRARETLGIFRHNSILFIEYFAVNHARARDLLLVTGWLAEKVLRRTTRLDQF